VDGANGTKEIRPIHRDAGIWHIGKGSDLWPLYRIGEVRELDLPRVYVVEGEAVADAGWKLGLPCISWQGGCKNARNADFRQLDGLDVVCLPDNDDGGRAAMQHVSTQVSGAKMVTLPGLPDHGDLVDFIEARDSRTDGQLRSMVEALADVAQVLQSPRPGVDLVRVADVARTEVEWLWKQRLALRKLHLMVALPDVGKGFVALNVASLISTGEPWPDDAYGTRRTPGSTIFVSCEDSVSDTIRPRLENMGADLNRVHVIRGVRDDDKPENLRALDLETDLAKVEAALKEVRDVQLIVFDPMSAYLGRNIDSWKDDSVRRVLGPLCEFAERASVAIIGIAHLRKGKTDSALARVVGSVAFGAAARVVWAMAYDPDDDTGDRRLLVSAKCNIGPRPKGLAYHIEAPGRLMWEPGMVDVTADDLFSPPRSREQRDSAADWLRDALADGPRTADEIKADAAAADIAFRTLRRAKQAAGVRHQKRWVDGGWTFFWFMPEDEERLPGERLKPKDAAE